MKLVLSKILGRYGDFTNVEPLLALFLGAALLAVFWTVMFRRKPVANDTPLPGVLRWLWSELSTLLWAFLLASLLLTGMSTLRSYLHQTVANFQRNHGRVSEANYNAVQTIWGAEQTQDELKFDMYWEEEVTERIESEDITKPALLRKKTVRHDITANPYLQARHEVTLRQNPRKKGSALYNGYETDCKFSWKLQNPTDRELKSDLTFPLPAAGAVYNDISATMNGRDILPLMELKDGTLSMPYHLKPNEPLDVQIAFKSRGMSFWYLQMKEQREIRDFTLTLNLPDLPKARLNNPEGCMTPTDVKPTANGQGSVLTYRLEHAISNKGMGIAFPTPDQPGETTNAVLRETEQGWLLIFALLVLGLTLADVKHAILLSVLFGAATALGYGLCGDFSDLLFGFWGTAALILLPVFLFLAWLLTKIVNGMNGRWLAILFLVFGIVLPCVAGLDSDRRSLYFNLCAAAFLAFTAWQLLRYIKPEPIAQTATA